MKYHIAFVLFAVCALTPISQGQSSCSDYNKPATIVPDITVRDVRGHYTGGHLFNGGAADNCTYKSAGGPDCGVTASSVPFGAVVEHGVLSTYPIGFHVKGIAFNSGNQYSNGGSASAVGTVAAAVDFCLSISCGVNVSANPISFPSGAIWTHGFNFSASCVAKPDPQYKNTNCTNTPGFVCCSGAGPVCVGNNTWQCPDGSSRCALPPPIGLCTNTNQTPYCKCDGGWGCNGGSSPLIFDPLGGGFFLTDVEHGVKGFDINADGKPVKMAWTDPRGGNAFLALPDENGQILSGKQLFGDHTDPNCDEAHGAGWCALRKWDLPENGGNGDGIIDWHDAVYARLVGWVDANQDAVAQPSEKHSLPEMGVYSIGLGNHTDQHPDRFGNIFRFKGVLNPRQIDGQSQDGRFMWDVIFKTEPREQTARPWINDLVDRLN